MKPNYNDLPFEFFGRWKGRLYDRRGVRYDDEFRRPERPLVSQHFRVKYLR